MSDYYEANPISTDQIRYIAETARAILELDIHEEMNLLDVLDFMCFKFKYKKFDYEIVEDNDKRFSKNEEAHTDITTGKIYIKQSVYLDLVMPYSRSNFTIAHEIGHFYLHHIFGFILPRCTKPDVAYKNPEWQADQFAAEFLMPLEGIQNLTSDEIMDKYNVSRQAAETRIKKTK